MRLFDTPTPRQRPPRERLAARGIACGVELKVADAGSIRCGHVADRRRGVGILHRHIDRRVRARLTTFARAIIGSRPICVFRDTRVILNALKPNTAARAKSHQQNRRPAAAASRTPGRISNHSSRTPLISLAVLGGG